MPVVMAVASAVYGMTLNPLQYRNAYSNYSRYDCCATWAISAQVVFSLKRMRCGRRDLNPGQPVGKAGQLTGLAYGRTEGTGTRREFRVKGLLPPVSRRNLMVY